MTTTLLQNQEWMKMSGRQVWQWLKRGGLVLIGGLVVLAIAGASYQAAATGLDRQKYPVPGQMVDAGGYRLHLNVMGQDQGLPTIILNAGAGSFSAQWGWVQPELAKVTRVVAFDRAGLGWSDPLPAGAPVDARTASAALHTALQQAGIEGPYILVGHSLGGAQAQVFADMYPAEVAGLVLLDAAHPEMWSYLSPEAAAEQQAFVQRARLLPLLARFGLMRLLNPFGANGEELPAQQAAEIKSLSATVRHLTAWRAEFEQLAPDTETIRQLQAAADLGDIPLVVVTRSEPDDSFTQAQQRVDAELVTHSSRGQQQLVAGADHFTLVTNPDHAHKIVEFVQDLLETR